MQFQIDFETIAKFVGTRVLYNHEILHQLSPFFLLTFSTYKLTNFVIPRQGTYGTYLHTCRRTQTFPYPISKSLCNVLAIFIKISQDSVWFYRILHNSEWFDNIPRFSKTNLPDSLGLLCAKYYWYVYLVYLMEFIYKKWMHTFS